MSLQDLFIYLFIYLFHIHYKNNTKSNYVYTIKDYSTDCN